MSNNEEEMRKQLADFQQLQQQLQMLAYQHQQMDLQLKDLEHTKEELKTAGEGQAYRFVGAFFVPKDKAQLEKDLQEEKETLELRAKTLQKQEEKMSERLESIRKWFERQQKAKGDGAAIG